MDLIGDYGSDVSDDEPHGASNGTSSAGNSTRAGPTAAVSPPLGEQLNRLPAPGRPADTDRWGSVFGAGILDRKRKPPAAAAGLSNGTAAKAANGHGHEEAAAPKRKLASFMAPLKPLSQEEMEVRLGCRDPEHDRHQGLVDKYGHQYACAVCKSSLQHR